MPSTEEYFSGKFEKCPNPDCGNTHAGDGIHRCNDCGKIFCLDCGSPFTLSLFSEACPNCNGDSSYIGEIKQKTCDVADVDSSDEDPYDDSSASDYTPSEYIAPSSSDYIPPSTVKKDTEGSGIWVLMVLALFLGWGFHLSKTDEPQKVAVAASSHEAVVASGGTTANDTTLIGENEQSAEDALALGSKEDVVPSENVAPVIIGTVDVPSLKLIAPESFPWRVSGTVEDVQYPYDGSSGQRLQGSKIFIRFDDGTSGVVTLSYDFGFQSGEYIRVTYLDDHQVSLLRLVGD